MASFQPIYTAKEELNWDEGVKEAITEDTIPNAKYGKISEKLRHTFPDTTNCSLFCGGKKCKYDYPDAWKKDDMVIDGLYSSWVTENILATSRPITLYMEKHNILQQFKTEGIRSIINLQTPFEHASCGQELHEMGFSYDPKQFMDENVFFYNFGWPDYSFGSLQNLLDMVRVMQFAVTEGKVAVHCHAGLGRTGVLIACYLVFVNRLPANEAIIFVRSKRPGAIQTSSQIACIFDFANYLSPLRIIYRTMKVQCSFDLSTFINRQSNVLHGFEARHLKHIPKIVYVLCERLLKLTYKMSPAKRQKKPKQFSSKERKKSLKILKDTAPKAFNNKYSDNDIDGEREQSIHKSHSEMNIASVEQRNLTTNARSLSNNGLHGETDRLRSSESDNDSSRSQTSYDEEHETLPDRSPRKTVDVVLAMSTYETDDAVTEAVTQYMDDLNDSDDTWWELDEEESDPAVLAQLLWKWLEELATPVLSMQDVQVFKKSESTQAFMDTLSKPVKHTIDYLFRVMARLHPIPQSTDDLEPRLLKRLLSALLQQQINADPISPPVVGQSIESNSSLISRTSNLSLFSNASMSSINSTKQLSSDISARLLVFAVELQDYWLEDFELKARKNADDRLLANEQRRTDKDRLKVSGTSKQKTSPRSRDGERANSKSPRDKSSHHRSPRDKSPGATLDDRRSPRR